MAKTNKVIIQACLCGAGTKKSQAPTVPYTPEEIARQVVEVAKAGASIAHIHVREDKMDIINVNGGAVALGHPVGSSGSRIIVSLLYEMKRRGLKYGLATLCIAGGMGQATIIEMCD